MTERVGPGLAGDLSHKERKRIDTQLAGIIIGGIIPAVVFGGYGAMQKQCMRAGLGVAGFFLVLGATAACSGLVFRVLDPGGGLTSVAVLAAVGFAVAWALGIGLILLAVSRYDASISQLVPLYNSATLGTVLLGLGLFSEWRDVRPLPLLLGAAAIVAGAVIVTRASRDADAGPRHGTPSGSNRRKGLLVGGLLPALVLSVTGPMMKCSVRAGAGTGEFLILFGVTLAAIGLGCRLWRRGGRISRAAVLTGIVTGALWALGTGLTLLALGRLGASISQITPLFNMNTLVVVLLGLWVFREHQQVRPAPLFVGAAAIILGAVLVAGA